MNYHFIAIGGSAMHNLAIALHLKGDVVTGSDDEIFEPSKGRLKKYGLLPDEIGWNSEFIGVEIDAVILGMHARADNPELLEAQNLNIPIYSYPEFIYEQTKGQTRVVIGGSHGKTSITSMILHVLKANNVDHNYMVGAQLDGFQCMVKLSDKPKVAVLEGDEYLSSPIDRRPKFHLYHPNVAVISGIAWDHINVFPTFENYIDQFKIFAEGVSKNGSLFYCSNDAPLVNMVSTVENSCFKKSYTTHSHIIDDGVTVLIDEMGNEIPIEVFGEHNLQNLKAAQLVCQTIGIDDLSFYDAIKTFKGASKRLELVCKNDNSSFYKDFAHSPSKLKATTKALKKQFKNRTLIACMELHTFSSLNKEFLKEYNQTMIDADEAYIYFNRATIKHKKLDDISEDDVLNSFGTENITVLTSSKELLKIILEKKWENQNLLMMSSGNFDGVDFNDLGSKIIY
jgi:UDP-N-acetylmuramate: L-alanyl-gamma-D-glutamyl-meso-diaminopimelate ligase